MALGHHELAEESRTLDRSGQWAHHDVMPESSWERWEALRSSPDPDPIEVLQAVSDFQNYFKAIEREATRVARAQGRTWQEIGSALGLTKQAVWQRADSEELEGRCRGGMGEDRRRSLLNRPRPAEGLAVSLLPPLR